MNTQESTDYVKSLAKSVGFDLCGITSADIIPEAAAHYTSWIKSGLHGDLEYLENIDRRTNPKEVMHEAKSVIMFGINYYSQEKDEATMHKIARYARGRDYHKYIGTMLRKMTRELEAKFPKELFRYFVDYGPFMERPYAEKAGIGFIGKNGLIISPEFGSWIFLSEIITSLELKHDNPSKRMCGSCTKCLVTCPTDAFVSPYVMDAKKCISFQTIENKTNSIPKEIKENISGWAFGCDICQEVCPFNNGLRQKETSHGDLKPRYTHLDKKDPAINDDELFLDKFKGTPLMRAKRKGIKRNLE